MTPPVTPNWDAVPGVGAGEKIGGPRHGAETTRTPRPQAWACPSCGHKQVSIFEYGCEKCGSGKPGQHVGVDPIVRKGEPQHGPDDRLPSPVVRDLREPDPRAPQPAPPGAGPGATLDPTEGFREWIRPLRGRYEPEIEELLYQAYLAGFQAMQGRVQADVASPLTGTPETRTILAALRFFKEQALPNMTEEITTGEILGEAGIDQIIARLERSQG